MIFDIVRMSRESRKYPDVHRWKTCHLRNLSTLFQILKIFMYNAFLELISHFVSSLPISANKCSMGLMSGPYEGGCKMWGKLYMIHCLTMCAVCLGSLSCWNWKLYGSPNFATHSSKLFFNISRHLYLSNILSTITRFPTPLFPLQLHTIINSPQCTTIGCRFLEFISLFVYLQILWHPSDPNMLNLISCGKTVRFQKSLSLMMHSLAKFNLIALFKIVAFQYISEWTCLF